MKDCNCSEMVCTELICHPKGRVVLDLTENSTEIDREFYYLNRVVIPSVIVPIIVLGFGGNALVIHVIRHVAKLRTLTNLLVINLAMVGAIFLISWGTFIVVHHVLPTWTLGDGLCKAAHYVRYVTSYNTIYTLVAIAVVRYIMVTCSPGSLLRKFLTVRNISTTLVLMWLVFILANIPILFIVGESKDVTVNSTYLVRYCDVTGDHLEEGKLLICLSFFFGYLLPVLAILISYAGILSYVKKAESQAATPMMQGTRTQHVTEMFVLLVATFAVCQFPLHVHLILNAFHVTASGSVTSLKLLTAWYVMQFLNHALNPLIYSLNSRIFREACHSVIFTKASSTATIQLS